MKKSVRLFILVLVACVGSNFAGLVYSVSAAPRWSDQGVITSHDWDFLGLPTTGLNNSTYDVPNFINESLYKEIVVQWVWAHQYSGNVPSIWETVRGTDFQLLGKEVFRIEGGVIVDLVIADKLFAPEPTN
jgi:hypothetical protein